jgi:hypothetical protein
MMRRRKTDYATLAGNDAFTFCFDKGFAPQKPDLGKYRANQKIKTFKINTKNPDYRVDGKETYP